MPASAPWAFAFGLLTFGALCILRSGKITRFVAIAIPKMR